jgi:tetratricopeptide (TPR) repeat protein
MDIARELANKTLAQDKSNLAGLMDTSGARDPEAHSTEANGSPSIVATTTDSSNSRQVEAMRAQLKLAAADSYSNLGVIAVTNNNYSGAVAYFERAAVWSPSLEGLDYNWGRAAFAGSQFADAIMPLSRYLESHPDNTGARSVLAISQFKTGNYHACLETLHSIIGTTALVPEVEYVYAVSMIKTGQISPGAERLRGLEKLHPEIPDVHRSLGEILGRQGARQRAIEEFRIAIQLNPSDADSHYDLGEVQLEDGNTAAAISELEAAVRLSPSNEKLHHELADAYTSALRPADAQKEMEICNILKKQALTSTSPHSPVARER